MVDFYRDLIKSENCEVEFVFSNSPKTILEYTNNVINCDIHTRYKTKKTLANMGANVYGLFEIIKNKKIILEKEYQEQKFSNEVCNKIKIFSKNFD